MRIPGIPFHQGRNDYVDGDGLHFGIAIHNTSNTASDENEASYADHRTDGTSSHFYVDRDSVTQSLDTDRKAGHAGSSNGNNNAIAFELTGTNDKSRQWWLDNIAWPKLGYVIAYLIQHDPDYRGFQVRRASVSEMQSNPKVKAFYGHDDMRRAWGGTTHTDPGGNFPWDRLFQAVNAALNPSAAVGDDMALTTDERRVLDNIEKILLDGLLKLQPSVTTKGQAMENFTTTSVFASTLTAAAAPVNVDATLLANQLAGDQAFVGAIAAAIADEVSDPAAQKQIAKDGAVAAAKVIADAIANIP